MLNNKIILLGILAALTFLVACREEPTQVPGGNATPPQVIPTPMENIISTPTATSTPTPGPSATPVATAPVPMATMTGSPAKPATASATSSAPTQSVDPTTAPTKAPVEPTASGSVRASAEDIAEIRQIIAEYWEALNDYDVDHAITMLEPTYRAQEEELIRKDIGRMKLFRVTLELSEETPPTINDEGNYETYLSLKTPIDTRTVLMVFRQIEGQWWIVYSDEVEE